MPRKDLRVRLKATGATGTIDRRHGNCSGYKTAREILSAPEIKDVMVKFDDTGQKQYLMPFLLEPLQ